VYAVKQRSKKGRIFFSGYVGSSTRFWIYLVSYAIANMNSYFCNFFSKAIQYVNAFNIRLASRKLVLQQMILVGTY
jgi:hypothetical protein